MTITLVDDVQPGQSIILVSAPQEMTLDKIYQVDQELIILRSAPRSSRVSVGRGMFGSTRATHAAGITVTPVSLVAKTGLPVSPPGPGVFVAVIDVSAASIRGCHTNPIELIASPGPDTVLVCLNVSGVTVPHGAAYSFAGSLWIVVGDIDGNAHLTQVDQLKTALASTQDDPYVSLDPFSSFFGSSLDVAGWPITLAAQVSDPAAGTADVRLAIEYRVVTVS